MPECLKCKSQRVTKGSVVNQQSEVPAVFRPKGLRFLSLTLAQWPQLAETGFACLDCGLVWSSTSPDKLAKFIRKHCDKTSDIPSA